MEYASLSDVETYTKMMYYGDAGTGKTTALLGLANVGPVLVINSEAGLKKTALANQGVNLDNIKVWPDPDSDTIISFKSLQELIDDLMSDDHPFVGVIVDSLTDVYRQLLDDVVAKAIEKAAAKGIDRDIAEIHQSDYGHAIEQCRLIVRRLRDMPMHVGFSALKRKDKNDDTGEIVGGPDLSPSLRRAVSGYLDIICFTRMLSHSDQDVVYGHFRPEGIHIGKDRNNILPAVVPTPNFERVLEYLDGDLTTENDEERNRVLELRSE